MFNIDTCKKHVAEHGVNKIIIIRKNNQNKVLIRPISLKTTTQPIVPSVISETCNCLFEIY